MADTTTLHSVPTSRRVVGINAPQTVQCIVLWLKQKLAVSR